MILEVKKHTVFVGMKYSSEPREIVETFKAPVSLNIDGIIEAVKKENRRGRLMADARTQELLEKNNESAFLLVDDPGYGSWQEAIYMVRKSDDKFEGKLVTFDGGYLMSGSNWSYSGLYRHILNELNDGKLKYVYKEGSWQGRRIMSTKEDLLEYEFDSGKTNHVSHGEWT